VIGVTKYFPTKSTNLTKRSVLTTRKAVIYKKGFTIDDIEEQKTGMLYIAILGATRICRLPKKKSIEWNSNTLLLL